MLKIAYSPLFCHRLPVSHRFPMAKYDLIPKKLLTDGIITQDNLFHPELLSEQEILSTHTADYWHKLKTGTLTDKEIRKIGLPMSASLIKRERYITHATYECALYAKEYGISLSVSGGTHHGFADHGEGFCVFNDVCVASNLLLARGQAKRILSVDLDVHQGNGNASIMANNPAVFVFSMHGKKNYPFIKPPSDLDIELDDGTGDEAYLTILSETLPKIIHNFDPDMLFYQAGGMYWRRINWVNYRLAYKAVMSETNWYSPPHTRRASLSLLSWVGAIHLTLRRWWRLIVGCLGWPWG